VYELNGGTLQPRKLAPLSATELQTRDNLGAHVEMLAGKIGGRSALHPQSLIASVEYIQGQLRSYGYSPERQTYSASGMTFENVEASLTNTAQPDRILIVGAHYDTAGGLPGANDNASGVAATLELACEFARHAQKRSVRWLFFANEEPPFFQGPAMGSYIYARRCRQRGDDIRAMISLETIGYYSDEPGSQRYPIGFHPGYPDRGDYLGFVSDLRSIFLLRRVVNAFRMHTSLPAQGGAAPTGIPGIGWSDHWSFWQFGYRALMVTDTAPYRYPYYHTAQDTPEKLDYDRMARAVTGLSAVVRDLASP
jgi:Zn-dependent M28 family amino/carboxypeptidase